MDTPLLSVHASVDAHLSCFPFGVIVNQVFMEILMSSRDLNIRKSGSSMVVQWLGLGTLAKKTKIFLESSQKFFGIQPDACILL